MTMEAGMSINAVSGHLGAIGSSRWQSVRRRDPRGTFVYAVRTTGVYCRPNCGARLPRRENVVFFDSYHDAERAGFRACKRCRPDQVDPKAQHAQRIARACRAMDACDAAPRLADLAAQARMSPFHFHRLFKRFTGLTPAAYAREARARRMRQSLSLTPRVSDSIYRAGFSGSGRFYEHATAALGMTPGAFREGGKGRQICFAVGECSLGSILVAGSDQGICEISLGDDPGPLVRELQDRFPAAQLVGGDAQFERWVAAVVGMVERPGLEAVLPLDIRGTVFQRRVWQALRRLRPGETTTYSRLARQIGLPNAARAVASACAANCLAVAIPCHRVVRTDGSISGYRWGVARKRELLGREKSPDTSR
ncbi:MAG TPA: bifunctional DNA-binding transcriptional regulator/O6-methylguanine-DNA methyltransferase Ada [Bryobacteraceae bacterium]|nr:bifunctional DNA-binding transcriptional regulator/O6-methylguanine-DNA methyltransferase Ada [Bryobacteraceae bacterium]